MGRLRPTLLQLFLLPITYGRNTIMQREYEVEVTIIGTANVRVQADSDAEAQAKAEESVSVIQGENWQYDATGVREHWVAETPDEALVVGA
jgi:hypothetical protein